MDSETSQSIPVPSSVGQETLRRFKYQLDYVLLRWLHLLASDDDSAIFCERHEDLDIVSAEIGGERIQVKTLSGGNWTLAKMTNKATPILQSFGKQLVLDGSLTFRFVTNAFGSSGAGEVGKAASLYDKLRSGQPLSAAEEKQRKEVLSRTRKRVAVDGLDHEQLLVRTVFDFDYCGIDDLELRVKQALRALVEEECGKLLAERDVHRLYLQLFGTVTVKSSARQGIDRRRLDSASLRDIISREARSVEIGPEVDMGKVSRDVTRLLEAAHLAGSDEGMAEDASRLTEEEEQRLESLQRRLLAPAAYPSTRILVNDRKELAELLSRKSADSQAESQLVQAIEDCGADDPDLFCTTVYAYANLLFDNDRDPAPLASYLVRYFDDVKRAFSFRWVEATHILSYLNLRGDPRADDRVAALREFLASLSPQGLDDLRDSLHRDEALMVLEALMGNAAGALACLQTLLSTVDEEPLFDHERLRLKVLSLEPLLARQEGYDNVFNAFAEYYEAKNAWGERADLYKQRGVSAYHREDFRAAITHTRVAQDGYRRVNATRGSLIAWHFIAHCYEKLDLKAAALQESLGLAIAALFNGVRDIGVSAIMDAARIAFDLRAYDDSLRLMLGHIRYAWAFGMEEDVEVATNNIALAVLSVATACDEPVTQRALAAAKEVVADRSYHEFLDDLVGAALNSDSEWQERLDTYPEEAARESMSRIREVLLSRRKEGERLPLAYDANLDGFSLTGSWDGEPALRNLVLGICGNLERFSAYFLPFLQKAGGRFTIETISFNDVSDLATRHDWVEEAFAHQGPAVLVGMAADRSPKVVIAVEQATWEESIGTLGQGLEGLVLGFCLNCVLAVYHGWEVNYTAQRVLEEAVTPNSFAFASCPNTASAIEYLGWPL